jgi:hypothetical protein
MEDYFSVSSVSNSSLSALNPAQGGSPVKFQKFFAQDWEKKNSLSLERGSLIHLYCEDPSQFVVSDIKKPSENISKIMELVYQDFKDFKDVDPDLVQWDTAKLEASILEACKIVDYGQAWLEKTRIDRVNKEGNEYLKFLISSDGRHAMSAATRDIIDKAIESLHRNKLAENLLFTADVPNVKHYNELPVFWVETVDVPGQPGDTVDIPCKGKLDRLSIDFLNKVITIPDLKSTSKSAYLFPDSFKFWRYYRQHAFYGRGVENFMAEHFPAEDLSTYTVKHYNIAVELCESFQTVVWEVQADWLKKGKDEYEHLLRTYAWHTYHNIWDTTMDEHFNGGFLVMPSPDELNIDEDEQD